MAINDIFSKKEASLAEVTAALSELHDREIEIRARIAEIDQEGAQLELVGDFEGLEKIRSEAKQLWSEIESLPRRVSALIAKQELAEQREAPGRVKEMLKHLPELLNRAEAARAGHLAVQEDLRGLINNLKNQKAIARYANLKSGKISEKQWERLVAVMDWIRFPDNTVPSDLDSRVRVSRAAKLGAALLDEDLEKESMVRAWRLAGFDLNPHRGSFKPLAEVDRG